jgi:mannosyl-glycoprotein endo-beta-N-acetylglucosaminidase
MHRSSNLTCKPISNLSSLLDWSPECVTSSRKFKIELLSPVYLAKRASCTPKFLVCHDMKNNYLEDKYLQGSDVANSYSFYHWNLIDMFIYFSHHFVTIPPESWINAAHENNVRMLGTIITEFGQGEKLCRDLFQNIDKCIEKLIELTVYYNFDGWLINIENKIEDMNTLRYFVDRLTSGLKKINPDLYKIIWYDSVIENGELKWQNELNKLNEHFFHTTDGFFVNYTWKQANLENSKVNASERYSDIYVGVDVFGRGCLGDGGFNCHVALDEIKKFDLSCAIFAPGWLHEFHNPQEFYKNSEKFWSALQESTCHRPILQLPLVSTFSHSSAGNFFLNGQKIESSWNNLNVQSLLPVLSKNNRDSKVEWCFDDGFYGGNSILVMPGADFKLFDLDVKLDSSTFLFVDFVVKSDYLDVIEKLSIQLNYTQSNQTKSIRLVNDKLDNEITSNCNLINFSNENFGFGWIRKLFCLKINQNTSLTCLSVQNAHELKSGKLGLVRVFSSTEMVEKTRKPKLNELSFSSDYKLNLFTLDGHNYLSLELTMKDFNSDKLKYFNVFINRNRNLSNGSTENPDLAFIGSTKTDKFFLCLKLSSNLDKDPTFSSNNCPLSFSIHVQFVDRGLSCLNEASGDALTQSLSICCPALKIKDNESVDQTFFERIIYDFEYF